MDSIEAINNGVTNGTSNIFTDEFLSKWFPEFPLEIIENVFEFLPVEIIRDKLLKVPRFRNVIIDTYFTREVHFILTAMEENHFDSSDYIWRNTKPKEVADISSFSASVNFLVANPDIKPDVIKIVASTDLSSMMKLFRDHHALLAQAPRLEVYIDHFDLRYEEIETIISLPNLFKIHASQISLHDSAVKIGTLLERSESIKELHLLFEKGFCWEDMTFPTSLTHLDIHYKIDPDDYWNGCVGGGFEAFAPLSQLKSLTVISADVPTINVSELPRSLEKLDLTSCRFNSYLTEGDSPSWPPLIKSMKLENCVSEACWGQLSAIKWPPALETMDLSDNYYTSLEHLTNLPPTLQHLDLSNNRFKTFKVKHNNDGYPFFKFPDGLQTLKLTSRYIETTYEDVDAPTYVEDLMRFPSQLKSLDLSLNFHTKLSSFVFPSSLETLSLVHNNIHDLLEYDLSRDSEEIVGWKHLTNLKLLDLRRNNIESLENWHSPPFLRELLLENNLIESPQDWFPPATLQNLSLKQNRITHLTASNTPLFNERFKSYTNNIQTLDLSHNPIESIDNHFELPCNLTKLDLSEHLIQEFVFTDAIAGHSKLTDLNVSAEKLRRISVDSPTKTYSCRFKRPILSITDCWLFTMSMEALFAVFKQMGLNAYTISEDAGTYAFK